ncbi:MAG: DUF2442 domain-containing protein [Oscillospiraceae bacterium]
MYEKEGIVYGESGCKEIEVTAVKVLEDMMLLVTFNNNEKRLYDCTELLNKPAFQPLKDAAIFENPTIGNGVVSWDNENIDIAPESMYANSFKYNTEDILVA